MIKKIALTLAALAFSSAASAALITDTVEQNVYLTTFQSHTYTHDLNDDEFVLGTALSGTISIDIYDDGGWFDLPEIIVIVIDAFDFDTGGLDILATGFDGDLEIGALAAINATGELVVKVTSLLGDFYVGNSVLAVTTADVPEPGTLALLGLGLMGLGIARRRVAA